MNVVKLRKYLLESVFFLLLAIAVACCVNTPVTASALTSTTVSPSGDKTGLTDFIALRNALRDYDTINLDNGGHYYIGGKDKGALDVDSNTTINAVGATIEQVNPGKGILKTSENATAGGYNAMKNVTINGGTWIGSTKKGATISLMKFFHSDGITITNINAKDIYSGHLLEFAGCRNVTVTGSTFGGSCPGSNGRNEAIELDNCSKGCLNLPNEKLFDNTACQNITFENNTVVFPRTFGSHYTYGKGKGKFNTNIKVKNNRLTATKDTGLIVFNWYDSEISENTITGTTLGLDVVTCFSQNNVVDFEGGKAALKKNNTKPYNVTIQNNTIKSNSGYALYVRGVKERPIFGVTVSNNTIESTKGNTKKQAAVVHILNATSKSKKPVTLKNNTIKNCKRDFAVYVAQSKYVNLDGNEVTISSSAVKNILYLANGAHNCTVKNNKLTGVKKATQYGIRINDAKKMTVTGNTIKNCKLGGIELYKCQNAKAQKNKISSCKKYGIYVYKGSKNKVSKNTIKGCKEKVKKI